MFSDECLFWIEELHKCCKYAIIDLLKTLKYEQKVSTYLLWPNIPLPKEPSMNVIIL